MCKGLSYVWSISNVIKVLLVFIISIGCGNKKNDVPKYRFYNLANAGWKSKTLFHNVKQINYKATQVPIQYYIYKDNVNEDVAVVDSIYNSLSQERVIEFEFQHDSKDDLLKGDYTKRGYTEAVKYMSFQLQNDFEVITASGKRIMCSGVTFERNFKLAPFKRVLLHFTGIPENENIQLLYEDKLFGNGLFKYNFKETPLKL